MLKSEGHGSFYVFKGVTMSEISSFKMSVKFATSLNMSEKLPQELYIILCRNTISGHISHKIH